MKRVTWLFSPTVLLTCIVAIAFILRFWHLDVTPLVNRDELAIGYNAYSILETGRDEHGILFPLSFQSFGDYKLPGLIYSAVLPISLFGRSVFSVRFMNALLGTVTIVVFYWFLQQLQNKPLISIFGAFLLSISPWHLLGSRSAYEPIVGLLWSLLSYGCLLKSRQQFSYMYGFLFFSVLATWFYNSALILTPIIYAFFVFARWFVGERVTKKYWFIFVGIFIYLSLYWVLLRDVNASRMNTTVFSVSNIETVSLPISRSLAKDHAPYFITRLSQLPFLYQISHIAQGYFASFNPAYLWFTGGDNPWHNLSRIDFGNLFVFTLPFFLIGIYVVIKKNILLPFERIFLLGLLFITPLAGSITIDAPNTNRLLDFHVAVTIITIFGLNWFCAKIHSRWKAILIGLCSLWVVAFLTLFFTVLQDDNRPLWNSQLPQTIVSTRFLVDPYPVVYVSSPANFSYIYYAFFTPFSPGDFQQHAQWTYNGLGQVTSYRKYRFESFQPLACYKMIEVSSAQLGEAEKNNIFVIKNRFGEPIWRVTEKQL